MSNEGTSSNTNDDESDQKGDTREPHVVPPDYESAEQKAHERGRWIMESMLKGTVSGIVRQALSEGLDHLGF